MPQRVVALEMPGSSVRAAVAERSWNSFHILGVFEEERRSGEADLHPALTRLLARTGRPDITVSAIPGEFVLKRLLELPFSDPRKLAQVVPFELEEQLPFAVEDAVIASSRVGRDGDNTIVIAALARKPDLRHHLELLARAGLDPKTVTLSELAIARLLSRSRSAAAQAHLVLDIEPTSTSMILLDSDGTPRAIRTVNAGITADDSGPLAEARAASILSAARQTLLAHASEVDKLDIILAGSVAGIPEVRKELSEALSLAVRDAAEFDYSFVLNGMRPDMSRFAGCVAMLLSELPSKPAELPNFRQGEFAFKGRLGAELSAFRTTAVIAGVAIGLALLHFTLGIATALHRVHALDRQLATISQPALGENPPPDAVAALRAGILKMNKRLALIGGNVTANSPLDALATLSRDIPKRFPVQMQDVAVDGNGVRVSGEADSFGTVDQVKKALSADGYFGNIEVTHAKAASDGKVEFQLEAKFRDGLGAE